MADKVYEKVSTPRVADNIRKDASDASRKLVKDMVEKFTGMGFKDAEVLPIIREGVKKGADQ